MDNGYGGLVDSRENEIVLRRSTKFCESGSAKDLHPSCSPSLGEDRLRLNRPGRWVGSPAFLYFQGGSAIVSRKVRNWPLVP